MSDKPAFEKVYEKPGAIWTQEQPPVQLVKFMERDILQKGSQVLDCACGEGTSAIYMAKEGMNVLGIDFSERAIGYAWDKARREKSLSRFKVFDALKLDQMSERFDFIFEWALIHHIRFEDVEPYVAKVAERLNDGGYYMSTCFNSDHPEYPQRGLKVFKTHLGTELRYHTLEEMHAIFSKHFTVVEAELIRMEGKGVWHPGNYYLLKKE